MLNEGLEVLGTEPYQENDEFYYGVFESSRVKDVSLPSTLKIIEQRTFLGCQDLKHITFPNSLEAIKLQAFKYSGLEEFIAPPSLRIIA